MELCDSESSAKKSHPQNVMGALDWGRLGDHHHCYCYCQIIVIIINIFQQQCSVATFDLCSPWSSSSSLVVSASPSLHSGFDIIVTNSTINITFITNITITIAIIITLASFRFFYHQYHHHESSTPTILNHSMIGVIKI